MSTMSAPEHVPVPVMTQIAGCRSCEALRRPRMFICDYHEGWWDAWSAFTEGKSVRRG